MLETKNVSNNDVGNGKTSIATRASIPRGKIALPIMSRYREIFMLPNVKSMTDSICQKFGLYGLGYRSHYP